MAKNKNALSSNWNKKLKDWVKKLKIKNYYNKIIDNNSFNNNGGVDLEIKFYNNKYERLQYTDHITTQTTK